MLSRAERLLGDAQAGGRIGGGPFHAVGTRLLRLTGAQADIGQ